jgi:putative flippase GtrA
MTKLLRFLLAGLPAYVIALGLNYLLAVELGVPKPLAYAVVLMVQIVVNFFACRYLVFEVHPEQNLWRSFVIFSNGIILFRLPDWGLYTLLTQYLPVPYLSHSKYYIFMVQLFNVVLFSLFKYEFARRLFERKKLAADSAPLDQGTEA